MSRLFVGNFSFEQARIPGGTLPQQIARFEAELACVWLAVAQAGDVILCETPLEEEFWLRMEALGLPRIRVAAQSELHECVVSEMMPWGWTSSIRALADRLRIETPSPEQEQVWRVNSRSFQVELCRALDCLLPGEEVVSSVRELERKLATGNWTEGWLVKADFGQAGRGQIRGKGRVLSTQQRSAISNILTRQKAVTLEPLLEPVLELGGQWEIPREGTPVWLGFAQLLTDSRGAYRGSGTNVVEISETARETVFQLQSRAVERLQREGYFGPVGIDAMIYRAEGREFLRPIQDINARWTMGRIALQWGSRLAARPEGKSEHGFWLHLKESPGSAAVSLSPRMLGGRPVQHLTWWKPYS